jgi:hypothetical protein
MRLPRQGTAGEAHASAKFEGRQDVGVTSAAAESGDTSVDIVKTPVSVENADDVSFFIVDENAGTRIATDNVPPCWDDCCQGRGSSFKTMQAYREHAQETHGWCKHCFLIFATPELADQHMMDTPFFCRQCRVCLPTKGEAAKHPATPRPGSVSQTKPPVRRKGNSKRGPRSPFPYCKSCKTYYLKPSPGQLHRCGTKNDFESRNGRKALACSICVRAMASLDSAQPLADHIADWHHPCVCEAYFSTEKALYKHKSTLLHGTCGKWMDDNAAAQPTPEKRVKGSDQTVFCCKPCDYKFATVDELVAHFQDMHFGRGYTCHTCNIQFGAILPFKDHLEREKTHSRF